MVEIIPAIIGKDIEEIRMRISMVRGLADWVQIDVADGDFAEPETWPYKNGEIKSVVEKISLLREVGVGPKIEFHLMIDNPDESLSTWIAAKPDRIYFHAEAAKNPKKIIDDLHEAGILAGVALKLETPVEKIIGYAGVLDAVQIMTIDSIGSYGRPFANSALDKVRLLQEKYPNVKISVDGGINLETAKEARAAGARGLVVGSAIFESENIADTIAKFEML